MQINALIQVINYLKEISENSAIIEGYRNLTDLVKEATSKPGSELNDAILTEKEKLKNLLLENDPSGWGYASYSFFEKINYNQLFGKAAADSLDNLFNDGIDLKTLHSDLSRKVKNITKLSDIISKFLQTFDQLIPMEAFHTAGSTDEKFTLFLFLEGKLSVRNITEMERYSRLWDGVFSTFSQLTGEEKLNLDIRSFNEGNIVLGAIAEDKTLNAFKTGVIGMLELFPLMLKTRKIQTEIALLPLEKNINELLEEEIQFMVNRKARELTQQLVSDYYNNSYVTEDLSNELSMVLKQILSFVEKGGRVEFRPAIPTPETTKTNIHLNELFALTHELENIEGALENTLTVESNPVGENE